MKQNQTTKKPNQQKHPNQPKPINVKKIPGCHNQEERHMASLVPHMTTMKPDPSSSTATCGLSPGE